MSTVKVEKSINNCNSVVLGQKMKIYFDYQELFKTREEIEALFGGEQQIIILAQIYEFVKQRLAVLNDAAKKEPDGYVKICVTDPHKPEVRFYGYSDQLAQKMRSCLSQQDFDFLMYQVWESLYPGVPPPEQEEE